MRLSIGQAWSETRAVMNRDGGLVAAVALALLVLPGTLVGLASPATASADGQQGWTGMLALLSGLIGLAGQLAISRIALGPPLTVREAIGVGFRRLPAFFVAALLWISPFIIGLFVTLLASGADLSNPDAPVPQPGMGAAVAVLLLTAAFLVVAVHMLLTNPAAADTRLGPVGLVKRSWGLSRGNGLKLFGVLVLVLIVALALVVGLGSAINTVILLLLGQAEPWNVSALLVSLVQQLLNAVVSATFAVMIARCYAQLAGRDEATASVPSAGHH